MARVKQHVKGISVDALLPKPANPRLVRRIVAPNNPDSLVPSLDPNQNTAKAVIRAQSAGPSLAVISLLLKMESSGIVIQ